MSRYIDVSDLNIPSDENDYDELVAFADKVAEMITDAPSIDIVFCKECKWEWTKKCPPHRMGLIHDASDYCSYGIRKTGGIDKHDEAIKAIAMLMKPKIEQTEREGEYEPNKQTSVVR